MQDLAEQPGAFLTLDGGTAAGLFGVQRLGDVDGDGFDDVYLEVEERSSDGERRIRDRIVYGAADLTTAGGGRREREATRRACRSRSSGFARRGGRRAPPAIASIGAFGFAADPVRAISGATPYARASSRVARAARRKGAANALVAKC